MGNAPRAGFSIADARKNPGCSVYSQLIIRLAVGDNTANYGLGKQTATRREEKREKPIET